MNTANFHFRLVTKKDLPELQAMYRDAFLPMYKKYHDDETDPYLESLDSLNKKWQQPSSNFYFFEKEEQRLGMIRVTTSNTGTDARISPLLILPKYQGHGYAQLMLEQIEQLYPTVHRWHLDTIAEEPKLIHLYQKMGYIQDPDRPVQILPGMHIVFFTKTRN